MHAIDDPNPSTPPAAPISGPWYRQLTRYHWFVLSVAALGWLFDCLDQQLFVLARPAAMKSLIPETPEESLKETKDWRTSAGDITTALFIAGWASGGLFFGMLGDRIGRAKTMMLTILIYSICTGLSALSVGVWDFALYRFLTGLGVGGEFAVGVALVAEVMPAYARPQALGLLQSLSAFGNIAAALINLGLGLAQEEGLVSSPWRIMFLIGALPALLALLIRTKLKEPERWEKISHEGVIHQRLGSYKELFSDPVWRKHALLGLVLGCAGIIGLWSLGFFTPDLIRAVQLKTVAQEVYTEQIAKAQQENDSAVAEKWVLIREYNKQEYNKQEKTVKLSEDLKLFRQQSGTENIIDGRLTRWASFTSIMINIGAFFGMYGFGALAQRIGRKPTFAIGLLAAFCSTAMVFAFLEHFWQIFVMVPIMGFCQLSLFAGYAIYFPELFPTRLRSTGTSFCYNVGRFVAAVGPLAKNALESFFRGMSDDRVLSIRYAGVTMCLVFLIGLIVLPFLPETKGKPLPE